jgi:hypothetical protein
LTPAELVGPVAECRVLQRNKLGRLLPIARFDILTGFGISGQQATFTELISAIAKDRLLKSGNKRNAIRSLGTHGPTTQSKTDQEGHYREHCRISDMLHRYTSTIQQVFVLRS